VHCDYMTLNAIQQQARYDALPTSARKLPNVVKHGIHHYHVHESLLAKRADGTVLAPLCSHCLGALQKAKMPEFSVANGKDFGRLDALCNEIGGQLTLAEQLVTAGCIRFQQVVKFVGSSDNRAGATSVRGHVIAFGHNGKHALEGVTTVLPRRNLQGHLDVAFVGEKRHWTALVAQGDARRRFLELNSQVQVNAARVFKYLHLKKLIDPRYRDIVIDDNEQTRALLGALTDALLDEATVVDSDVGVQIEQAVTDNVARQEDAARVVADRVGAALDAVFVAPPVVSEQGDVLGATRDALDKVRTLHSVRCLTVACRSCRWSTHASTQQRLSTSSPTTPSIFCTDLLICF